MTEPSRLPKNWKFLLALLALLAVFLFPLVRGLVSGFGAPGSAAPAPTSTPEPPVVSIQAKAGTGPAGRFDACAVLTPEVLAAAGLAYGGAVLVIGPDAGQADIAKSCGGPVEVQNAVLTPQVLLRVPERDMRVSGVTASHGLTYERHADGDAVDVWFAAAGLRVGDFSRLPGGEATLAKLIDGIAANLAAGPKPAPEYRYPAPYDLAAKPCDALPLDVVTALTSHPTDGEQTEVLPVTEGFIFPGLNVRMECWRATKATEDVRLKRTIYRNAESAADGTKFLCRTEKGAKASAVSDVACTSHDDDREYRILFHVGREAVELEYRADHPPAGDLSETARKVLALLGA